MTDSKPKALQKLKKGTLNRALIVAAAIHIADDLGVERVTMRAVATSVGVEAMSLYNHVSNRADLLDAMIDTVIAEIKLPPENEEWTQGLRNIAQSTRTVLRQHSWATGMIDSRSKPGFATLRHHNQILGMLRRSGFSTTMAIHALAVLDSYVYGSVLQENALQLDHLGDQKTAAIELLKQLPVDEYPYLAEVAQERATLGDSAPNTDDEFNFGLELIVQGLKPDEK
ncbi:TetR/AcrR family transcriptional regulator C-terminal domain-containing protein [Timonella sp. A28]|uniref:TetR/AcrR family transcriptional regulator C-terminal domain-containing protein n=1 Tax=Timonella sp. A28 TaxID=3442640 RepID=UPI003EC094B9